MATPAEISASLTMEDIPIKLRCAACNRLANNAFRMPCCDQSICEDCQESLPTACPVCLHEPISKDDCRPNKALRTTVKAFLKRKGIELEAAKKKEMKNAMATDPDIVSPTAKDLSHEKPREQTLSEKAGGNQVGEGDAKLEKEDLAASAGDGSGPHGAPPRPGGSVDAQRDIPQKSIESPGPQGTPRRTSLPVAADAILPHDHPTGDEQQNFQASMAGQHGHWNHGHGSMPSLGNHGQNFDGMNGGFANMGNMGNMGGMGFNGVGDFNQMMNLMPNGMPNNTMGAFPNMMGMPGMGMDPMAMSQGMYGGFGGPGMGMNGMNMGMGFDAGQNAFGGFNGQPQNPNSYGGQMGGNYGGNTAYGGYNMPQHQGNFNQMPQHQNFNHDFQAGHQNQGFQYRGRGRGRGNFYNAGRGRGFTPAYPGRQTNIDPAQNQALQQPLRRGSPVYTPMVGSDAGETKPQPTQAPSEPTKHGAIETQDQIEEQFNRELAPGDAEEVANVSEDQAQDTGANEAIAKDYTEVSKENQDPGPSKVEDNKPIPIPSVLSDQVSVGNPLESEKKQDDASVMSPPPTPVIPTGPASQRTDFHNLANPRGRGFGRGFFRGGADPGYVPSGRGSSSSHDAHSRAPSFSSTDQIQQPPTEPRGVGVQGAPTAPKALRQGLPNTGIRPPQDSGFSIVGRASASTQVQTNGERQAKSPKSRHSQSRSRSPSVHRSPRHRHHRRHSRSSSRERNREKRQGRDEFAVEDDDDNAVEESKVSRARGKSVDSMGRRYSHAKHREHDKETSSKHRSYRSHREKSRSRERDHRSGRKRSKSPDLQINGASRRRSGANGRSSNVPVDDDEEERSSRKRRDRDDESQYREKKRSRRDEVKLPDRSNEAGHRSKPSRHEEKDSRFSSDRTTKNEPKAAERPRSPPKGPKIDQHALEREARNRERQMKEIQRRALMEGKGTGIKGRSSGRPGERRYSYKYEDEDLASRVEKERESGRWG